MPFEEEPGSPEQESRPPTPEQGSAAEGTPQRSTSEAVPKVQETGQRLDEEAQARIRAARAHAEKAEAEAETAKAEARRAKIEAQLAEVALRQQREASRKQKEANGQNQEKEKTRRREEEKRRTEAERRRKEADQQAEQEKLRLEQIEHQERQNPILREIREAQDTLADLKDQITAAKNKGKRINPSIYENQLAMLSGDFIEDLTSPEAQKDKDKIILTAEGYEMAEYGLGRGDPPSVEVLKGLREVVKNQGLERDVDEEGKINYQTKYDESIGPFRDIDDDTIAALEKKLDPKHWFLKPDDLDYYQKLMNTEKLVLKPADEIVVARERYKLRSRLKYSKLVSMFTGAQTGPMKVVPKPVDPELLAITEQVLSRRQNRSPDQIIWNSFMPLNKILNEEKQAADKHLARQEELEHLARQTQAEKLVADKRQQTNN